MSPPTNPTVLEGFTFGVVRLCEFGSTGLLKAFQALVFLGTLLKAAASGDQQRFGPEADKFWPPQSLLF
jgi:hypothetical protein